MIMATTPILASQLPPKICSHSRSLTLAGLPSLGGAFSAGTGTASRLGIAAAGGAGIACVRSRAARRSFIRATSSPRRRTSSWSACGCSGEVSPGPCAGSEGPSASGAGSREPQKMQKRLVGSFSRWQLGHCVVPPPLTPSLLSSPLLPRRCRQPYHASPVSVCPRLSRESPGIMQWWI